LNEKSVTRIKHGLVAACLGDPGRMTYKKSRIGEAEIDKTVAYVLQTSGDKFEIVDFSPYGYDERQYCSPGFNLPVGCLMRTPHGRYTEYHTSADNLDFIRQEFLEDSFLKYLSVLNLIENNRRYRNLNPKCEPQLGKRGLYDSLGGQKDQALRQMAMLWVLNLSDGENSLLDISERSGLGFEIIRDVADVLINHHLLAECL
jgi:aminopeptidase-like protein